MPKRASAIFVAATLLALVSRAGEAAAEDDNQKKPKTEVGGVPLVGGDSDIGVGVGELSSVTRLEPGYTPYRWHLESGALITFKPPAGDGIRIPYQDYYVRFEAPGLFFKALRLEVRPSFTKETSQLYYGIGNGTPAPDTGPMGEAASDYFQYGRMHPTLLVRARIHLGGGVSFLTGDSITYNHIDVHPNSKLSQDLASGDPEVSRFFGPVTPHFVNFFEQALLYDTRDDETNPMTGMYHQVKLRLSPGGAGAFPYRYGQVDTIARFYTTPIRAKLSVDFRLVFDAQFGNPPFYELARYEDTFALGGVNGVRGVPAQRYYGKIKLFGNLETRSPLTSFKLWNGLYEVAGAVFVDAGRLWSDWVRQENFDGSGLGLKYGVGLGLRVQKGKAFVVRADVAWSPDARPIAGYFTAGQLF